MSENSNLRVSQAFGEGDDCPTLDELIDRTSGKNGDQPRLQAEAHVAACPHCATELALFREFQEPAIRPEEKADVAAIVVRLRQNSPVARTSWWKSVWTVRWMAPASVALASILVGTMLWMPGRTGSGGGPQVSGSDDVMRSARVEVVGPAGAVFNAPARLEWIAVKGAVRYQVSLNEVDRTRVWSGTVEGESAMVPPDVLAKIVPRKAFIWQVFALDKDGAIIADSGMTRFQLVPGQNQ